ncbi:MAG: ABC transporter permease [Edaphobacter sp.]|uniref:ABC transporter permease n=1 Tax=Edaphobacter sp. TaxID=1934404 RepID=UPI00239649F4|nr:ABC transporter permease [Edaphobacter sp.]MDE1176739.1 ABC transporter permease [Edaphobacter sp.]
MQNILSDLRYALRQLRRAPVFALTAVLTLALGIGANTAIFSLLDQALLRSLPVYKPEQLVYLQGTGKAWNGHSSSHGGGIESYFSYPMYRDLRDKDAAFDSLVATSKTDVTLTRNGASEFAAAEIVSGNYFTTLGIAPALGRFFTQADDRQKDATPVIVLSYDYWQKHLSGDPSVVNDTLSLNGHPFKVIGIAGPRFHSAVWGETPALFVPMAMLGQVIPGQDRRLTDHTDRWMNIIGRMKDGVTTKQAETMSAPLWHALRADELKALGTQSRRFTDEFLTNSHLLVQPAARGFSYNRGDYQTPLLVIMGMAALVLLIAVVNVASLLLVRSATRVREFSLRAALGARSLRIVQQLLLEGLLIGVGGGILGVVLAPLAMRVLVQRIAGDGAPFNSTMDARLLLFNFAVALGVSVLFSLAPALQMMRPNLMLSLRAQGASATGGHLNFRRIVVGVQIGLSLLLLVGAGLFVRTIQQLRTFDVGFRTDHTVTFGLAPRLVGYDVSRIPAMRERMIEALGAMPGVESVGATNSPLLGQSAHSGNVSFAGYKAAPEEDINIIKTNVSSGFFTTMSVPMLYGRAFTPQDDTAHPKVAIVNEALAKRYFGSAGKALGQRLVDGDPKNPTYDTEIVGVTRDIIYADLRDEVKPSMYSPLKQATGLDVDRSLYFYVRTQMAPTAVFANIRRTVAQVDPLLALDDLRTMDDQLNNDLQNERMIAFLAVTFGVLATLLAGVGLYGVMAYTTGQRTREIGIRMALGSSRWAVGRLVFLDVIKLASAGVIVGVPLAIALSRLLKSQLFQVSTADPLVLTVAVALVTLVAVASALLPARKAASVEPSEVLRAE